MPTDELVKWWNQSSEIDREYGANAYWTYRKDIRSVAKKYRAAPIITADMDRYAAAFALLSPNSSYEDNLRSLDVVMAGFIAGVPSDQLEGLTTYRHCAARAYRILAGEPDYQVFSPNAKKTYKFYRNIQDPADPAFVTIDGHMHNLWSGAGPRPLDKSGFKPSLYDTIAADFIAVAKAIDIPPSQFQATLWWAWKRINSIRFDYQIKLDLGMPDVIAVGMEESEIV